MSRTATSSLDKVTKGARVNPITDPNSSGQGYDADHSNQPFDAVIRKYGYSYSHSTPVRYSTGIRIHHTYKKGDHNVGVTPTASGGWKWDAGKGGSGHGYSGSTVEKLEKYLAGRKKKGNPSSAADSMHESFHGMPPTETIAYTDRLHVHSHLAGIGTLVGLKVRTVCGDNVALYFEKKPGDKKGNPAPKESSPAFKAGYSWLKAKVRTAKGSFLTTPGALSYMKKIGMESTKDLMPPYANDAVRARVQFAEKAYRDFLDGAELAWQERLDSQYSNPSLSHYVSGKAAGVSTANFIPYKSNIPTEAAAYKLQGDLSRKGIGSRVDRVRTRLLPTPKYHFEILVDRDDYKHHAARHVNSGLKLPRSKQGGGVFKPAVKFVGEVVDSIYKPADEVIRQGAGALDRGLKLNPKYKSGDKVYKNFRFHPYLASDEKYHWYLSKAPRPRDEVSGVFGPFDSMDEAIADAKNWIDKRIAGARWLNPKANPQFAGPAQLATNEKGTQLFIQGGDQSIDLASIKITGAEASKENVVIGEVWLISYFTTKVFDGETETAEYVHTFSTDTAHERMPKKADLWDDARPPEKKFGTGELPILIYRPLEQRLIFAGGVYFIDQPLLSTSPGIEN